MTGGEIVGDSHADGGVKTIVVPTGQTLYLEGEEVVINKKSAQSKKLFEFEGRKLPVKHILNEINTMDGNGDPIPIDGMSNSEIDSVFEGGGEIPSDKTASTPSNKWSQPEIWFEFVLGDEFNDLQREASSFYDSCEASNTFLPTPLLVALAVNLYESKLVTLAKKFIAKFKKEGRKLSKTELYDATFYGLAIICLDMMGDEESLHSSAAPEIFSLMEPALVP